MINFPEKILIDTVLYDIKRTDEPIINDGQECSGIIDHGKAEILVSSKKDAIGDGNFPVVLMHEIVHAILYERGMMDDSKNETLVDELAKGFINFIRTNQEMVRCIVDAGKMAEAFEEEEMSKNFSLNSLVHNGSY